MKAGEMSVGGFKSFKVRSDLHLARKAWHLLSVLLIAVIYHNLSRQESLAALAIATAVFVSIDILRKYIKPLNKIMVTAFAPVMRKHEIQGIAGTTYLLTGALIVFFLFDKSIVKLTLIFLAVGDPVASLFGLLYGKDRIIGKKTLQGSIAAFCVCSIIAFFYYLSGSLMLDRLIIASLLSGLIGALSELIPIGKLDDNFTFPLISAFLLYGLFQLFGAYA